MEGLDQRIRTLPARLAALPDSLLLLLFFAAVALSHLTLLHLPYFWDEGGYYIPAALDFYHTGQLVPHFTNGHPPLPNILLGTLWRIVGYHILATRLLACGFAALGLMAIFRLTERLLDASAALAVASLSGAYPIWFAQSSLAHADIFAAAFTLWAFALYLPSLQAPSTRLGAVGHARPPYVSVAVLFSLAALSKETSIIQPAALAAWELWLLLRDRKRPRLSTSAGHPLDHGQVANLKSAANAGPNLPQPLGSHSAWLASLCFPVLPLITWFAYHHHVVGFTFGNPTFLRYNATANLTAAHIQQALRYRFLHLFWQRNIWLPIVFALACLLLLPPRKKAPASLQADPLFAMAVLVAANWFAFSILGGALLTRYLLPMYPLILIVCVHCWQSRTQRWPLLAVATGAAFISALWLNPPAFFAPEDNLTYRDMIVVHQEAIDFVQQHYPHATILTAWPVSSDLFEPYLGYVKHPMRVVSIQDFTLPQILIAAREPDRYNTALVFTTHLVTPWLRHYLLNHPNTRRGRAFSATRDLTPAEIANLLGGQIVWQDERGGEWAAVIRFHRGEAAGLCAKCLSLPK
ncbi:MAG: ArnT family glycosyltransferase [Acidobacteriaceae bacterium]